MMKQEDVIKQLRRSDAQKIKVAITDIDGILRGKYMQTEKFLSAAESGFGFCNVVLGWDSHDVCYDNVKYTGWHSGYPDAKVNIDIDAFRTVPWDNHVPFFLGDFVDNDDKPLPICPRQLLKQSVAQAEVLGMFPKFGMEFEWFNFQETPDTLVEKDFHGLKPLTPGMFGYSILRSSYCGEYFNALMDLLREFDVPLEGLHTETGPGVYEAAIAFSDALEAADRAVLFKTSVKEIAYNYGIIASFMARWNASLPGCSGHLHQSLQDQSGKNVFFDKTDPNQMSSTFKSYLAGQLRCLPEILPMFAPTVNSYKRLVEGYWAPTKATWSIDNRTVALRVINGSEKSIRVENRVPGADVNPYLAIAASLASGLYGVENKLNLEQEAVRGSGYEASGAAFPKTLREATQRFESSAIAKELFGREFVEHFSATRHWESQQYANAVTDWELKRYFELG